MMSFLTIFLLFHLISPEIVFFFFLIFNIQSRTLLQLSVVNYIHNIVQSAQHMQIQPCSSVINSFMTDVPVI